MSIRPALTKARSVAGDNPPCCVRIGRENRRKMIDWNVPIDCQTDVLLDAESQQITATRSTLDKTSDLIEDYHHLYHGLTRIVKLPGDETAPELKKAALLVLHLLMNCRYLFTMGILTLLRGHSSDSFLYLRRAVEACAFAARIRQHPHLAQVWLDAADSDKAYKAYHEKFKKLFPQDDALLADLGERYDRCSKMMHNTLYSVAARFSYDNSSGAETIRLSFFDPISEDSLICRFYFALDSHSRILRVFTRILANEVKDGVPEWELRFNSVQAKLDHHRELWKPVVPDPRRPDH